MEDKESHGTANNSNIGEPFEKGDVLEKRLKKVKISRSIGPICRELSNDMQNLIFLLEDEAEVLHTVKEKLEEIRAMLKGSIKTGKFVFGTTTNRKQKKKN